MRDAVAPLRRARAVAGAPLGPLGAPNWPSLELAARNARTSALEALRAGVNIPQAELAEVACTARAVLSRSLALEAYVALCTGQPSSAWTRTCDETISDAFDTERLEAVTARADAHASLEIQFLAESSPQATPVPPFSQDADALLASAALVLELRRCMCKGTPTGAVRVALEAARGLRASSLRARGRFLVLRTVLGGVRAVAPATGGRALDAARALILDGMLSEASIEEVVWHSVRADIAQIRAVDARPGCAAEALAEARVLGATIASIGLPPSAALDAASVANLVTRTRAQAIDNLRAALAAGAIRGSPGALIAPFGGETEWLRTLATVESAANAVLAHAPGILTASAEPTESFVEIAEDAPDSAEHESSVLERSARLLLRARRALLVQGAMGISVLNSTEESSSLEVGTDSDWLSAIRDLRATDLHSSCVAETLLLHLSVRTHDVCTALAAAFLQSDDTSFPVGANNAAYKPSDTDTATPARAITDAAALAAQLNEEEERAPPQLASLVTVAGFILSLRTARASGDDAAAIRATLTNAVSAGTLSRLSPTTFALDGVTAKTLSVRVMQSINSEVARASVAADDSASAAAALARADAIDRAVESAIAARARARDILFSGLEEALIAEDAGTSSTCLENTLAWVEGALSLAGGEGADGCPLKTRLAASRRLILGRAALAARDWATVADILAPDTVSVSAVPGAAPAATALSRLATAASISRSCLDVSDFAGALAMRDLRQKALGAAAFAMGFVALSAALDAASGNQCDSVGVVLASASIDAASTRTALPVAVIAMSRAAKAIAAMVESNIAGSSGAAASSATKALAEIEAALEACGGLPPSLLLSARVEIVALARKATEASHLTAARIALREAAASHHVVNFDALDSAGRAGALCETGVTVIHALRTASAFFSHSSYSSVSALTLLSSFANVVPPQLLDAARSSIQQEAISVSSDERDAALLRGVHIAGEVGEAAAAVASSAAELGRVLFSDTSVALTAARLAERRAESLLGSLSLTTTPSLPTLIVSVLTERAARLRDFAHITIALTQVSASLVLNAGGGLRDAASSLNAAVDRVTHVVSPRSIVSSLTLSVVRDIAVGSALLQSLIDSTSASPTALALTGLDPAAQLGSLIESACGVSANRLILASSAVTSALNHILSRNAEAGSLVVRVDEVGALKSIVAARNNIADAVLSNALDYSLAAAITVLHARAFKASNESSTAVRIAELELALSVECVLQFIGHLESRHQECLVGVLPLVLARAKVLLALHGATKALTFDDWEEAHAHLCRALPGAVSIPKLTALGVLATRISDARALLSLSAALRSAPIAPREVTTGDVWPGIDSSAIRNDLPSLASALQSAEGASTALGPVLRAVSAALSLRRAIVSRDWSSARLHLAARAPLGAPTPAALWPVLLCNAWTAIASVIDADALAAASEMSARTLSRGPLFNVLVAQRDEVDAEMNSEFNTFASAVSSGTRTMRDGVERGAGDAMAHHLIAFGVAVTRAISSASPVIRAIVDRDAPGILRDITIVVPELDAARSDLCVYEGTINLSQYTTEDADDIACALSGSFSVIDTLRVKVRRAAAAAALSNALTWSATESPALAADRATAATELARGLLEQFDSSAALGYFFDDAFSARAVIATAEGVAAIRAARASCSTLAATGTALSHALLFVVGRDNFTPSLASLELQWSEHVSEVIAAHTALVNALTNGGEVAAAVLEASAVLERVSTSTAAASEPALILLSAVPIGAAFARLRDAVFNNAEDVSDAAADASTEVIGGARRAHFSDALITALEAESRGDAAAHAFSSVACALIHALSQTHGRALSAAGVSTRALREAVAAASSVLALDMYAHGAARVRALADGAASLIEIRECVRAGELAAARARAQSFRRCGGEAARLAADEVAFVEELRVAGGDVESTACDASAASPVVAFDIAQLVDDAASEQSVADSAVGSGRDAEFDALVGARQSLARAVFKGSLPAIVDATLHLKALLCHALARDSRIATTLPVVRSLLAGKELPSSPPTVKVDAISFALSSCPALRPWTEWRSNVGAAAQYSAPLEVAPPPVRGCIDWLATRAQVGGVLTVSPVALTTSAARAVLAHDVAALHSNVGVFVSGGSCADREGAFTVVPITDDEPTASAISSALDAFRCARKHSPVLDDELYFSLARIVAGGEEPTASRALSLMGTAARADILPSPDAENHIEWFLRSGCISDMKSIAERLSVPPPPRAESVLFDLHAAVARSLFTGSGQRGLDREPCEVSASLFQNHR